MLSRVGKKNSEHVSRVLGRISKRQPVEETPPRMLTRMSKRGNEEMTTRILGRMTKRGKFANMRWRRAEDDSPGGSFKSESLEPLGGFFEPLALPSSSWPGKERTWESPAEMIHLGNHWINLAPTTRPNAWGRVSKRTVNDDGRRFSRIGMVENRESEMAKRSGVSGRFVRIGVVGEDEENESHELRKKKSGAQQPHWGVRIVKKRSGNDQSSRWIRIGVNQDHQNWESRISKKSEGKEWNPKFYQHLRLSSESEGGEGVSKGEVWEDEDEEEATEEEDEDEVEVEREDDEHAESLEEEEDADVDWVG